MLAAEKGALQAQTAVDVYVLRRKELEYYTAQIQTLNTVAALMAGFALQFLVWEKTMDNWHFESAWSEVWWDGEFVQSVRDWDFVEWWCYVWHFLHVLAMIAAIIKNLQVVQVGLVALLLGHGMALRGPPGSMTISVARLGDTLNVIGHGFITGILFFVLAITFYTLEVFTYVFDSVPHSLMLAIAYR